MSAKHVSRMFLAAFDGSLSTTWRLGFLLIFSIGTSPVSDKTKGSSSSAILFSLCVLFGLNPFSALHLVHFAQFPQPFFVESTPGQPNSGIYRKTSSSSVELSGFAYEGRVDCRAHRPISFTLRFDAEDRIARDWHAKMIIKLNFTTRKKIQSSYIPERIS